MQIAVALDGSKRRDITLFQGDTVSIELVVYAEDGDDTPIVPTGIRFVDLNGAGFVYGTPFGVSENDVGRHWYRLVGEIDGATATLAFGYLNVEGAYGGWYCGCYDGYWTSP
jgi:hypothetical protein